MQLEEIRNRYLKAFEREGHVIIPSASLVPENDPTMLFTGAGMQPLLTFFLGTPHPEGKRLVDSQKCFRAEDMDEVGDNRHTTFFEMLGNWSFGDYFKKEQLAWFFSFLTDNLSIPPERLYVTAYRGNETLSIPKDTESAEIWKELFKKKGIEAHEVELGTEEHASLVGMQGGRIFYYDTKNWWSRAGAPDRMPAGEPGGPDSEVFFELTHIVHDAKFGQYCHPNCDCGRFMEIGNSVFMEYKKNADGSFSRLPEKNVDFGGGLERISAAVLGTSDVFKIDVFAPIIEILERVSGRQYETSAEEIKRSFRIIADHMRAAVFIAADGVLPSNKERGYIMRRLVRRALFNASKLGIRDSEYLAHIIASFVTSYGDFYTDLSDKSDAIKEALISEANKFAETLSSGLSMFEKLVGTGSLGAKEIFDLYQSYGFPTELSVELAKERGIAVDLNAVNEFLKGHKDASRAGSEKRFKGGLADTSEMSVKYHTATHMLNQALRTVLGSHVYQKGSNITPERLRFDFPNDEKLTPEQIAAVEKLVNEKIREALPVTRVQMTLPQAYEAGAVGVFGEKYPDIVTVYRIGTEGNYFSQEICGGPHVENTSALGGVFKITKEEAVAKGIRRIKAVIE